MKATIKVKLYPNHKKARHLRQSLGNVRFIWNKLLEKEIEVYENENRVGIVSSGNFSPCLGKGIALAYVNIKHRKIGKELIIRGRRDIKAKVIKGPFVKKGEC
mgnify:CR=1 FL=1